MIIQLHGHDARQVNDEKVIKDAFKEAIEKSGHWCYHCGRVNIENGLSLCRKCGKILSGRC